MDGAPRSRNRVRTAGEALGKGDGVGAIKIILSTPDQSKHICNPLRRHAVFSCQESSANPWTFDLFIALLVPPCTLGTPPRCHSFHDTSRLLKKG